MKTTKRRALSGTLALLALLLAWPSWVAQLGRATDQADARLRPDRGFLPAYIATSLVTHPGFTIAKPMKSACCTVRSTPPA